MTVRRTWSDDRIDGLELKVDEGFRHVDQRFEQIDKRLERIEVGTDNLHRMMVTFAVGLVGCSAALFSTLFVLVLIQL